MYLHVMLKSGAYPTHTGNERLLHPTDHAAIAVVQQTVRYEQSDWVYKYDVDVVLY